LDTFMRLASCGRLIPETAAALAIAGFRLRVISDTPNPPCLKPPWASFDGG
jgi:hypothetical protein